MNILDLTITFIIVLIIYKFITQQNNNQGEPFVDEHRFSENRFSDVDITSCDDYDKDPSKYIDIILKSKNKEVINPHFLEMQYHQDYRDTMNAFNLIVPNQRQIFNRGDLPILTMEKPTNTEIKTLVTSFIKEVNKTLKYSVGDSYGLTNWDDNLPEKKYKSGWDKQQEALGLPCSVYTDPAPKAPIKLIKMDHAEKYETEDELKYLIFMIIQKKNVDDQLVVKVSFVVDKRDWNLDREFFNKKKNTYETSVKIEDVAIVGFTTKNKFGKVSSREDFYNFKQSANSNDLDIATNTIMYGNSADDNICKYGKMYSQKNIIKELNKKKRIYEKEFNEQLN
jgi:hypothetical protein